MNSISLLHTIGKPEIDGPLARMISLYESTFPGRVRGYYLLGSYADGRAVVGSDLDTYALFKEAYLTPYEVVRA